MKRSVGVVLLVVGSMVMLSGGAMALVGSGSSSTQQEASPGIESTSQPSPEVTTTSLMATTTTLLEVDPPAPPTTTIDSEAPAEFITLYADALARGDVEFLMDRLHPSVVSGYGETSCQDWINTEILALGSYSQTDDASGPGERTYAIAGENVVISTVFSVPVSFTFAGQSHEAVADVALEQGTIFWLGVCR